MPGRLRRRHAYHLCPLFLCSCCPPSALVRPKPCLTPASLPAHDVLHRHQDPVPASAAEVDSEEVAIRAVGVQACPLRVVLERVVATPAGAVLACWQVGGRGITPRRAQGCAPGARHCAHSRGSRGEQRGEATGACMAFRRKAHTAWLGVHL